MVALQEAGQAQNLVFVNAQGGFPIHTVDDGFDAASLPARKNLEIEPVNAKKAVAGRILDQPGRAAVWIVCGSDQTQFLAKKRNFNRWLARGKF